MTSILRLSELVRLCSRLDKFNLALNLESEVNAHAIFSVFLKIFYQQNVNKDQDLLGNIEKLLIA